MTQMEIKNTFKAQKKLNKSILKCVKELVYVLKCFNLSKEDNYKSPYLKKIGVTIKFADGCFLDDCIRGLCLKGQNKIEFYWCGYTHTIPLKYIENPKLIRTDLIRIIQKKQS